MGALTLAASLKRVNTSRKLAIMVTSEGWLLVNIINHHHACYHGHLNNHHQPSLPSWSPGKVSCRFREEKLCQAKANSIFSVFPCIDGT